MKLIYRASFSRVFCRVSDRGGGMPRRVAGQVFDYNYTTAGGGGAGRAQPQPLAIFHGVMDSNPQAAQNPVKMHG